MTAFYNEIDPYAAQWLRNLIDAGHIAPGVVDERSIEDILPDELRDYTQCHFFAGIGVWSYALRQSGWPDDQPVWTGSCPCQPFSAAGKGNGFADERHLWPAFHYLIEHCRPAVVLGEQVASKDADAWIDLVHADMEGVGYAFGCVPFPSTGVGAPHIRDRNYWGAYTNHARSQGRRGMPQRAHQRSARSRGVVVGLADSHRSACGEGGSVVRGWTSGSDAQPRAGLGGGIVPDGMAHTNGGLADAEGKRQSREPIREVIGGPQIGTEDFCGSGGLADSLVQQRPDGQPGVGTVNDSCRRIEGATETAGLRGDLRPGPTNGFWGDADWLLCRDGKWRPVEPGTFPLAHGATSRVGRLRAYGNAINAEAARVFITAFGEALRLQDMLS